MRKTIDGTIYDTDRATWVVQCRRGEHDATVYQMPTGEYFLHRADAIEPLTELEVRRFVVSVDERQRIQDAVDRIAQIPGFDLGEQQKFEIVEAAHRQARVEGIFRTGSLADLAKFLGDDDDHSH
jgi:hypothetical protein